ncbi:MAG TPA: hypothetical protein VEX88_14925 [Glaciibacter sp.]|nr:hypothetical protein [Glaciibacter sp.]
MKQKSLMKRCNRYGGGLFLAVLLLSLPVAAYAGLSEQGRKSPAIAFEQNAVVITGVTPNARVVVFGVSRRAVAYVWRTSNVSVTVESDAEGMARLELERPVWVNSIYAAVDFTTGRYTIASPQGTPRRVTDTFETDRGRFRVLCVRPGEGAWRISPDDLSGGDRRTAAGSVQSERRMPAIAGEHASPGRLRTHDVVIVIDPEQMAVVTAAVPQ